MLRQPADPLTNINATIRTLVKNMYATQARQNGIGLAAPQVGLSRRLFVVDTTEVVREGSAAVFINPEIIGTHGTIVCEEGCLSFPGIHLDIPRPRQVGVRYLDLEGEEHTLEAEGILARIILHEYDHLEGKLFVDTLTAEARERIAALLRNKGDLAAQP